MKNGGNINQLDCEGQMQRLAPQSPSGPSPQRRRREMRTFMNGFTLAEVLITLGIIGVIAALTIPTLINSYQEKARITKLKKAYAVLQQAYIQASYEQGGPLSKWGLTNTYTGTNDESGAMILDHSGRTQFMSYLTKYLKQGTSGSLSWSGSYSLDGRKYGEASSVTTSDKSTNYNSSDFLMADGTYIIVGWVNSSNTDFWLYLPNEKELKTGVTRFHFIITDEGFIPDGRDQSSFSTYCNVKNKTISSDLSGRSCTAWAIYNENMEYLRCNDLSWDGKKKCD